MAGCRVSAAPEEHHVAQNQVPKQVNLIVNISNTVVALLANVDALEELTDQYSNDGYGTGGANAITDATVQSGNAAGNGPLPAATALQVAEAVGVINGSGGLLALFGNTGTQRGYLENVRP
jgi:hypothetical protein